ncbi:hypothetical protein ACI2KA_26820, partial [Agrobacterium sp. NPDC089420]
ARTSGENLFVVLLVIDPTSHELGSPANPVRFNRLNDTPRECLDFQTPKEIFSRHFLDMESQSV